MLVGWINHSATDCYPHSRSSGDGVNLGIDLDAASSFVLVASHPGHSEAVTLELAPLLASEATDFQAMTKAQIVEFCSSVDDVELDGSQTKAELVQQATALAAQASGSSDPSSDAADLATQELGDALL